PSLVWTRPDGTAAALILAFLAESEPVAALAQSTTTAQVPVRSAESLRRLTLSPFSWLRALGGALGGLDYTTGYDWLLGQPGILVRDVEGARDPRGRGARPWRIRRSRPHARLPLP